MRPVSPWDIDLLKRDRLSRGWTYSVIAKDTKLSVGTVQRFFLGANHSPQTAKKIALALGYPLERYVMGAARRIA